MRTLRQPPPPRGRSPKRRRVLSLALLVAFAAPVMAAEQPTLVVDAAEIASPAQEAEIEGAFSEVFSREQVPLIFASISSMADLGIGQLDGYANYVFSFYESSDHSPR